MQTHLHVCLSGFSALPGPNPSLLPALWGLIGRCTSSKTWPRCCVHKAPGRRRWRRGDRRWWLKWEVVHWTQETCRDTWKKNIYIYTQMAMEREIYVCICVCVYLFVYWLDPRSTYTLDQEWWGECERYREWLGLVARFSSWLPFDFDTRHVCGRCWPA